MWVSSCIEQSIELKVIEVYYKSACTVVWNLARIVAECLLVEGFSIKNVQGTKRWIAQWCVISDFKAHSNVCGYFWLCIHKADEINVETSDTIFGFWWVSFQGIIYEMFLHSIEVLSLTWEECHIAYGTSYIPLAEGEMTFGVKPLFLVDVNSMPLIKADYVYFNHIRHLLYLRMLHEMSRKSHEVLQVTHIITNNLHMDKRRVI